MHVVVNQNNLKKALSLVERVVSRNVALPILNNVLLKTENGRLKISATNLEIGSTYVIGAKIEEVGEIAVPARILTDFISNVREEVLTLTTKNNSLFIQSKKYKTQLLGFDTKEYPIIPKIRDGSICVVSVSQLQQALSATLDSVAVSETRVELSGLFVKFSERSITFAATDSFRLVEYVLPVSCSREASVIIPRNTVGELLRVAGEIEGDITVHVNDNQVSFSSDDCELVSRLIDGHYPEYQRVIPEKFVAKALVSKSDLENTARLAGLFSSSISDIKFSCAKNSLQVSAKNSDRGEASIHVDAVLKNDPFEISLNYHYLLDGLKILPTDKVVIEFTGTGSPLVLRPEDDHHKLVYLIMPLRQ